MNTKSNEFTSFGSRKGEVTLERGEGIMAAYQSDAGGANSFLSFGGNCTADVFVGRQEVVERAPLIFVR